MVSEVNCTGMERDFFAANERKLWASCCSSSYCLLLIRTLIEVRISHCIVKCLLEVSIGHGFRQSIDNWSLLRKRQFDFGELSLILWIDAPLVDAKNTLCHFVWLAILWWSLKNWALWWLERHLCPVSLIHTLIV